MDVTFEGEGVVAFPLAFVGGVGGRGGNTGIPVPDVGGGEGGVVTFGVVVVTLPVVMFGWVTWLV